MATLIGEAIDPTTRRAPRLSVFADTLVEPEPTVPEPSPGDPDEEYVPADPTAVGLRVQVLIQRAISRERIGWLDSAVVDDWDEDVDLLVGSSCSISASSSDPLWEAMAERSWTGADGEVKHTWDPKGYVVTVHLSGLGEWTGVFPRPIDIGAGRVVLPCEGPQAILLSRFLGRIEQVDLYDGWGDFETVPLGEEPPGIVKSNPEIEAVVVADGVRGTKALRVTGRGYIDCPKVPIMGGDGASATAEGSTFGKWSAATKVGYSTIRTYTQRADSLAPSNVDVSQERAGKIPDDARGRWSEAPVVSGAMLTADPIIHRTWNRLYGFAASTVYDIVALRQGILTGYINPRDLADYVALVLATVNSPSFGGSPTGLTSRIDSLTGVEVSKHWAHNTHPVVSEVLREILEADGGPECRITPGWVLGIRARSGSNRADLALTVHEVRQPAWAVDAFAQTDDLIVDTGRGSGTSLVTVSISQPYDPDRYRITGVVQAPTGMDFNAIERWGRRHARERARVQSTAQVDVPWDQGRQFVTGDTVHVSLHEGAMGLDEPMRILNRRFRPADQTITLTLGAA